MISIGSAIVLAAAVSGGAWAQGGAGGGASAPVKAKSAEQARSTARSAQKSRKSARVEAVQRALNEHGAKLNVDGHEGTSTREALKKFQADNGLKATGRIDKATLDKLGVK